MDLSELKRLGKIREIPIDKLQTENLIGVAKRDLVVAEKLAKEDLDWSFIAAYNSMLQMSRALMFSYGYTTSEEEHHKTSIEFVGAILSGDEKAFVGLLDRMRRKRHNVTYDEAGQISEFEAKEAVTTARKYLGLVEKKIKSRLASS